MWVFLSLIIATFGLILHCIMKTVDRKSKYWTTLGFPTLTDTVTAWDLITGSKTPLQQDAALYQEICNLKHDVGGIMEFGPFGTPVLFIKDLDIAKNIFIKDFDNFVDRRDIGKLDKLIDDAINSLKGQEWRNMRAFLSPTFTSGKLKRMFIHFRRSAQNLKEFITSHPPQSDSSYDINLSEAMRKFTVEVIGSAAFGMSTNVFKEKKSILYEMTERIGTFSILRKIRFALIINFPRLSEFFQLSAIDKEVSDFFWGLLGSSIKARQEGAVEGSDFLQILVETQKNVKSDETCTFDEQETQEIITAFKDKVGGNKKDIKWTLDLAIRQAFAFLSAGFETLSNNLSVALWVLSTRADVQDQIFDEIERLVGDEELTYEKVHSLEYLDMFTSETLRLYPGASRLDRICKEDYPITVTEMGTKTIKIIPKGTVVAISAEAIHRDPYHYPNPLYFDPSHFSQENKVKRNPYAYIPFGIGPRNCIGMRFALAETKLAIAHIVKNFIICSVPETTITSTEENNIVRSIIGFKTKEGLKLRFSLRS